MAKVAFRFRARDVHVVMGPKKNETSFRFRILIDGMPPETSFGSDIDSGGNGTAEQQCMYHLIRQSGLIHERLIEIEFLDSGVEAFVFTFG